MMTLFALVAALAAGYGVYAGSFTAFFIAGFALFLIVIDEFGYDDAKKPSGRTR